MKAYQYTVTEEVLVSFSQARLREREELLRAFSTLVGEPFRRGQSCFKDDAGREHQVQRLGRWMFVYWVDHADCRIVILSAERLRLT